ncbi:MAG: hypothetical protein RBT49_00175 [Bacteroidales bacterium]|jgi:hypothetical protein|nr:hypothetical protein [Bacteroidales bacterium]
MLKKFSYKILSDKSLILEYYSGDFNIKEFIESKDKVSKDNDYNPNFDIIHDFRDIKFQIEAEEIFQYIQHISFGSILFGKRRSVAITSNPNQLVPPMLFKLNKENLPVSVKICSTYERAFSFIGLTINEKILVESLFNEIKNSILQTDRS